MLIYRILCIHFINHDYIYAYMSSLGCVNEMSFYSLVALTHYQLCALLMKVLRISKRHATD